MDDELLRRKFCVTDNVRIQSSSRSIVSADPACS